MDRNYEKYSGIASLYRKYRPSYPKDLIDYLYLQVGFLSCSTIADIGSGTGLFSRLLLERGSFVYCIEPNSDMRQTAESDLGGNRSSLFFSVNAIAENTGLQEKSVDFVTVAQAFHWFDREAFKSECNRILKSSGKVVLIWNTRDYNAEVVKKEYEIREKYYIGIQSLMARDIQKCDVHGFFSDNVFEERVFSNELVVSREAYIGMYLSGAYSPRENTNPNEYHGLKRELSILFDEFNIDQSIHLPHFTKSYVGMV